MASANPLSGTVSLVVAITGHRDLFEEDRADLQAEVESIFAGLRDQYPATPLLLLSGLAEGADRIAVRAAQAAKPQPVPYMAVLPMPEHLYRADFTTEAGDREFQELLDGSCRRILLPLVEGVTEEDVAQEGPRAAQYEQLGEFLVNYSQIMIAIWDKKRIGKPGGASDVVAMKLGEKRLRDLDAGPGNNAGAGPVYQLLARRMCEGPVMPTGVQFEVSYPEGTTENEYEASYRLLERYNKEVAEASQRLRNAAAKCRDELFAGATAVGLTPAMKWAAAIYSWADALSVRHSTRGLRLWTAVFVLLAIGGVALTWMHTLDGGWQTLAIYYLCLGVAFALGRFEIKTKGRGRHEDYRALAEALRVQFYWMVAGLPDLASNKYPRQRSGEMTWIRDAMSECGLFDGVFERTHREKSESAARLDLTLRWVEGQAEYFRKTYRNHKRKRRIFNRIALALAGVGIVSPLVPFLVPRPGPEFAHRADAISGVAMWWAALAWSYSERRGFAQEARQYARMYDLFYAAGKDLKRDVWDGTEASFARSEKIIRELGDEALEENADWLAMHRERKLTPGLGIG